MKTAHGMCHCDEFQTAFVSLYIGCFSAKSILMFLICIVRDDVRDLNATIKRIFCLAVHLAGNVRLELTI